MTAHVATGIVSGGGCYIAGRDLLYCLEHYTLSIIGGQGSQSVQGSDAVLRPRELSVFMTMQRLSCPAGMSRVLALQPRWFGDLHNAARSKSRATEEGERSHEALTERKR